MIFPELPRPYQKYSSWNVADTEQLETPLRCSTEPTAPSRITVEEWWIKHGLAKDPAAGPYRSSQEPIDYWAKDAWEFYALCVAMLCWTVFWWGSHRGLW